jgi:hypothetical protein
MGCTPSSWKERPKVRAPTDHGVPLDVYCHQNRCSAKVKGVVTARGGDHVDWYSLAIPCTERVSIALGWEIPREGSELVLSFWVSDAHGRGFRDIKTMRQQAREDAAKQPDDEEADDDDDDDDNDDNDDETTSARKPPSKGRLTMNHYDVPPGAHSIGVHARGVIGAGAYTLDVVEKFSPACANGTWTPTGWVPRGDVILPRPENLAPPRKPRTATIAGRARRDHVRRHVTQ